MSRPIRVLAMINTLEVGGTEARLVELARRLPLNRFDFQIACMVGAGAYEERVREAGRAIHLLGHRAMREEGRLRAGRVAALPRTVWRVAKLLRRVRPDVFHTFLPNCNVLGAAGAALCGFRRLVASRVFTSDYRAVNPLYPIIEGWAARRARVVLCNCEALRREVLTREKVRPERVRVIHNGVDTERFAPRAPDPAARRNLGLPDGSLVVGIVANFLPHKRHEDFLAAAAQVVQQFPNARFLLAGRPCDREGELRALAAQLGIARQTHFLGPRDDLPALYPLMDVLVSTSTDEGLSNALLEGQACGVPVVATAIAGTPEIVEDGVTGFLAPPRAPETVAEQLSALLANTPLRRRFGSAARERVVERFAIQKMVDAHAALYQALSGQRQ